jgi:hypothetical protein
LQGKHRLIRKEFARAYTFLCKLSTDQQAAVALSKGGEEEVQDRLTVLLDEICEQVEIKEEGPPVEQKLSLPAKVDFTTAAFSAQDLGTGTAFPQQIVPPTSGFPAQTLPPGFPAQGSLPPAPPGFS